MISSSATTKIKTHSEGYREKPNNALCLPVSNPDVTMVLSGKQKMYLNACLRAQFGDLRSVTSAEGDRNIL